MTSFNDLINQGSSNAWLFIPSAILLGALHGLEPGHSKTMMAAFIIAVRGTLGQAILLGLCAAFSHSLIIWIMAAVALKFSSTWNIETTEPYFQIASGFLILGIALWIFWRLQQERQAALNHARHHHSNDQDHHHESDHHHEIIDEEYEDAHERAHATEIARRFKNKPVTTRTIILFGLTGGLLPCPAAFTVLLICLQLKKFTLGFALVGFFSLGLALTLVSVGAAAAWGVHHTFRRFSGLHQLAHKAPYLSSALLACLGLYIVLQGSLHLYR